jgi:hypothetical protein
VNRFVKKGSKAFYILAPYLTKVEKDDGQEETLLKGFLAVSVFRYEDTEGEPLNYPEFQLPELPLIEVAEAWGISTKSVPGNYRYYGYYSKERKEIGLAAKEEIVFFHELSHAAHEKVLGQLKTGQRWNQEIVAELGASVLCELVGKRGDMYLGNSFRYISLYAQKADLSPLSACLKVMTDVEKVLQMILGGGVFGLDKD